MIEVRALSEGGEGAVSSQVRIVTSSGKTITGLLPPLLRSFLAWPFKSGPICTGRFFLSTDPMLCT